MRTYGRASGRGRVGFVIALLALTAVALAAIRFLQAEPPVPSVGLSEAAAQSGRQKVETLARAETEASRTGRAVRISQTFTDAEISSLANEEAQSRHLPLERVLLHATGQGRIQGQATTNAGGQRVPVSFELVPEATADSIHVRVTRVSVAAMPLPGPLADELVGHLQQLLNVQRSQVALCQLHVTTGEGQVTVSGVAEPS